MATKTNFASYNNKIHWSGQKKLIFVYNFCNKDDDIIYHIYYTYTGVQYQLHLQTIFSRLNSFTGCIVEYININRNGDFFKWAENWK